jgi:hypothetical protein
MHAVGLATYAACVALLFIGTLWRAPVAVAAVLCMFGLDQLGQMSHPWLLQHQTFTNYIVGVLLLLGLVRKRTGASQPLSGNHEIWLAVLLYGYAFTSLLWTTVPEAAWKQWLAAGPYVAVALACPLLVTSQRDMWLALRWTSVIGLVLSFVVLVFGNWGIRGLMVGYYATETNPLALASLAGVVAATTLFVGFGRKSWLEWLLRLAGVVICVLLIIRSGSRGQLLAVVASLALMLPMRFSLARVRGLVPAVLACVAIVVALDVGSSLYVVNDEARWSSAQAGADVTGRFAMVLALLNEWSKSPLTILFGLGTSASFGLMGIYPHNMPAEVLGEEGLIGFSLLLSLLIPTAAVFLRLRRSAQQWPERAEVLAASGALALFCFMLSLKQGNLLGNYLVFTTVLLAGRVAHAIGLQGQSDAQAEGASDVAGSRVFANLLR